MASSRRAGAVVRLGQANRLALGSDSAAEKPAKQNVNNTERECKRGQRGRERRVRLPACGINLSFCRFYALALLCSASELQPPAPPPAQFGVAVCFAAFRGCSSVPLAVPVCVPVSVSVCVCVCVCLYTLRLGLQLAGNFVDRIRVGAAQLNNILCILLQRRLLAAIETVECAYAIIVP